MTTSETFWQFNFGHLLTILTLIMSFYFAHRNTSIKNEEIQRLLDARLEQEARDRQEMKTKLDLIYNWFMNSIINARRDRPSNEG